MPCGEVARSLPDTTSASGFATSGLADLQRKAAAPARWPIAGEEGVSLTSWEADDWDHDLLAEDMIPAVGTTSTVPPGPRSEKRPSAAPSRGLGETISSSLNPNSETLPDTLRAAAGTRRPTLDHRIPPLPSLAQRAQRSLLPRRATLVWGLLLLGITALVCGAILTSMSTLPGRAALWGIGLPMVLIGQTTFLIGVYLQLEDIWQGHRDSARALEIMQRQLDKIGPELPNGNGTPHPQTAPAGVSRPDWVAADIVLTDLKQQLDRVAARMRQLG